MQSNVAITSTIVAAQRVHLRVHRRQCESTGLRAFRAVRLIRARVLRVCGERERERGTFNVMNLTLLSFNGLS